MEDWRKHKLIVFESVQRWMRELKCKDSSKWQFLESFKRFLRAINVENPDRLIDDYIQDMKSDDPRIRLRTQDRLNKFYEEKNPYAGYSAWMSFIAARSFYNANGCPITAKAPFPKSPLREKIKLPTNEETANMARLAPPVLRSLILTLAESGMRINSAVQILYGDIKEDYEANRVPMGIRLRGKITKKPACPIGRMFSTMQGTLSKFSLTCGRLRENLSLMRHACFLFANNMQFNKFGFSVTL